MAERALPILGCNAKQKHPGEVYIKFWARKAEGMAIMLCPCGCGDELEINIGRTGTHELTIRKGLLNFHPAIRRTVKCKVHFVIKNGEILIQPDSGARQRPNRL